MHGKTHGFPMGSRSGLWIGFDFETTTGGLTDLSDADLDARISGIGQPDPEPPAEEPVTAERPTAPEPPPEPEAPGKGAETPETPRWVPEGPTDPRAWAHFAQEREKEAKQRASDLERENADLRARLQPAPAPALEIPDRDLDPAGYAEYLFAYQQQQQQIRDQASYWERVQDAEDRIRDKHADYDATIAQAGELARQGKIDLKALTSDARKAPLAVYQEIKRITAPPPKTEAEIEAEIERRAQAKFDAVQAKTKPPLPTVEGVARAGSVAPGLPAEKTPRQMTDAELAEAVEADRRKAVRPR